MSDPKAVHQIDPRTANDALDYALKAQINGYHWVSKEEMRDYANLKERLLFFGKGIFWYPDDEIYLICQTNETDESKEEFKRRAMNDMKDKQKPVKQINSDR